MSDESSPNALYKLVTIIEIVVAVSNESLHFQKAFECQQNLVGTNNKKASTLF